MGSKDKNTWASERPAHRVRVGGFWMDETEVTNAQFRAFVEATGYVTTAEQVPTLEEIMVQLPPGTPPPHPGVLVAGALVFSPPSHPVPLNNSAADGKTYKVHLDGYNQLPLLTGETDKSARNEVFYFSDDGDLTALRYADWKLIFMEQKVEETLEIWQAPYVPLRFPLTINLRRDPYERGMKTSNTYWDWVIDRIYLMVPAQVYVGKFLATFKDYPPQMKAASFSLDQVMEKLQESGGSK